MHIIPQALHRIDRTQQHQQEDRGTTVLRRWRNQKTNPLSQQNTVGRTVHVAMKINHAIEKRKAVKVKLPSTTRWVVVLKVLNVSIEKTNDGVGP